MQPPHPSRPLHQQQAQKQVAFYTCLMQPEICQGRPGACPKCGLALESVPPAWDDSDNSELIDFRRRFWSTLPLTAAVFLLAMFDQRRGWFAMATQSWIEFVRSQPSAAIKSLLGLALKAAWRIELDGSKTDVPLSHVHVGDRLRVRPGEKCRLMVSLSKAAARSVN